MPWRMVVMAACAALACRVLLVRAQVPGIGAALVALALLLALGGWAFHATGDRGLRFRRDVFVAVAAGILLAVLSSFLW